MQETWVQSLGREDPLEKEMATHSLLLPGKSHAQRSPAGTDHGVARMGHDFTTKPPPRKGKARQYRKTY